MAAIFEKRLPGIVFQNVPPPRKEPLPPMDIAAFVGFAASGPLHTPVVIEDMATFRDLFGDDLPLAWDNERHEMQPALLAPAVRDFFRNGGRRCWVVRVAERFASSQFLVPFLVGVAADNSSSFHYRMVEAYAEARSQGTWADELQLNTAMQPTLLREAEMTVAGEAYQISLSGAAREIVTRGDLLRVDFPANQTRLFLPVAEVVDPALSGDEQFDSSLPYAHIARSQGYWFKEMTTLPPNLAAFDARPLRHNMTASLPLLPLEFLESPPSVGDQVQLVVALPLEETPPPGTMIELSGETTSYLFPISKCEPARLAADAGSPVLVNATILTAASLWQRLARPSDETALLADNYTITQLRFEMQASQHEQLGTRLLDLAFVPDHERYWGRLPKDEDLFDRRPQAVTHEREKMLGNKLLAQVAFPRFPFSYSAERRDDVMLFLPIGMPFQANTEARQSRIILASPTRLERNGLKSFGAHLFLDENLGRHFTSTLNSEAFHKQHVRGLSLQGLHALYEVEEISLIAVPEAVHRPWQREPFRRRILAAPNLSSPALAGTTARLSWSAVSSAVEYEWQQDETPEFIAPSTHTVKAATRDELSLPSDCPRELWFRVRAVNASEKGPWSNTPRLVFPSDDFAGCETIIRIAPDLQLQLPRPDEVELGWNEIAGANAYELQRAPAPSFEGAATILLKPVLHHREFHPGNRFDWYRVRAWFDAAPGPWSITQVAGAADEHNDELVAESAYDDNSLLEIHRGLLRFCGARADLFAVLSLPFHYDENQALTHKARLIPNGSKKAASSQSAAPPLSLDELRVTSYGAIYHPWLIGSDEIFSARRGKVPLRRTPADAAICGRIAQRSRQRGAWIAPANEALTGVLALVPGLASERELDLFTAQLNGIRQEARGFLPISAFTLSPESEWRQINVRRLMILLRRLALREGDRHVFQPNDLSLRRLMQRTFEGVLSDLYQRGAFAGAQPDQAFRVVTDDSVNTPQSLDAGRLIIELRVAPSQPMMFITVRLVQTAEGALVEESILAA